MISLFVPMKKNVLLIDDDDICHFISKAILERTGAVNGITSTYSGSQALDHIVTQYNQTSTLPDIVLVDICMPFMDGFQFISELRNLTHIPHQHMHIALLSSSIDVCDHEKAQQMGIKQLLSKPLSESDVHNMINNTVSETSL